MHDAAAIDSVSQETQAVRLPAPPLSLAVPPVGVADVDDLSTEQGEGPHAAGAGVGHPHAVVRIHVEAPHHRAPHLFVAEGEACLQRVPVQVVGRHPGGLRLAPHVEHSSVQCQTPVHWEILTSASSATVRRKC